MVWLMDEINNVVPDDSDKFFRKIFNFADHNYADHLILQGVQTKFLIITINENGCCTFVSVLSI